ncbi:MAG: hypothetical protein HY553_08750 [Elusimicrobia bacterium]|nr:hypothetical protein [Elusimicrobiota bacterium]
MRRTPTLPITPFVLALTLIIPGNPASAGSSLAEKLAKDAKKFAREVKQDVKQAKQEGATAQQLRQEVREEAKELRQEVRKDVRQAVRQGEVTKEEAKEAVKEIVGEIRDKVKDFVQEVRKELPKGEGRPSNSAPPPETVSQAVNSTLNSAGELLGNVAVPPIPGLGTTGELSATGQGATSGNGTTARPAAATGTGPSAGKVIEQAPPKTTPLADLPGVTTVKDAERSLSTSVRRILKGAEPGARIEDTLAKVQDLSVRPAVETALNSKVQLPKDSSGLPAAEAKTVSLVRGMKTRLNMREYRQAERDADEALLLDPQNVDALQTRAEARLRQGNAEGALADAALAAKIDPRNPHNWILWVDALAKLQNTDEALRVIGQALQHHPRNALLYLRQAALLDQTGKRDDALGALAKAAELNSRYELAYQAALKGAKIKYPDFDEDLVVDDLGRGSRRFGPLGWALAVGCFLCLGAALWLLRRRQPEWIVALDAKAAAPAAPLFAVQYQTVRVLS